MSPARRTAAWLTSTWLLGGCAVDLWVGEPTSTTDAGATGSTGGDTSIEPPTTEAGTSTTGAEPPATTEGETTLALDDGTSTTGHVPEEGSSTGPLEEGTTSGAEIPCRGLGMLDCNELGHCLWYGPAEMGECAPNPCENLEHDCWMLPVGDCEALFACAWTGEGELGECAPIECVPCEVLGIDQCTETPTCVWDEGEMFCLPA